jgi:hypothetical protein
MLRLPTKGFSRSINVHNSRLDVACDWLEGSVLFAEDRISTTDVIDVLIEEQMYDDQDFASEFVDNIWSELKRREKLLGSGSPFVIASAKIKRKYSWNEAIAHSFCLIVSLLPYYPKLAEQFGNDYTEQGELFELLTKESLEKQFSGWIIFSTGWTRTNAKKIGNIVQEVSDRLGEIKGDWEQWINSDANEAGLDLLCYRPFFDKRVGIPVYLLQCASGQDWSKKQHTPNIDLWEKLVLFAAKPQKAFAIPYVVLDYDFRKYCNLVRGMFLDRYRILTPTNDNINWISQTLNSKITKWLKPRISKLKSIVN